MKNKYQSLFCSTYNMTHMLLKQVWTSLNQTDLESESTEAVAHRLVVDSSLKTRCLVWSMPLEHNPCFLQLCVEGEKRSILVA